MPSIAGDQPEVPMVLHHSRLPPTLASKLQAAAPELHNLRHDSPVTASPNLVSNEAVTSDFDRKIEAENVALFPYFPARASSPDESPGNDNGAKKCGIVHNELTDVANLQATSADIRRSASLSPELIHAMAVEYHRARRVAEGDAETETDETEITEEDMEQAHADWIADGRGFGA